MGVCWSNRDPFIYFLYGKRLIKAIYEKILNNAKEISYFKTKVFILLNKPLLLRPFHGWAYLLMGFYTGGKRFW